MRSKYLKARTRDWKDAPEVHRNQLTKGIRYARNQYYHQLWSIPDNVEFISSGKKKTLLNADLELTRTP